MIAPLVTRLATDADVPGLVALVNSAYRGDSSRAGWTTEADLLDGMRIDAERLKATMADEGDNAILVHEDEGHLVACVHLRRTGSRSLGGPDDVANASSLATVKATPRRRRGTQGSEASEAQRGHARRSEANLASCYLGMLTTSPTRQGSGLGRAMIEQAERFARDHWGSTSMEITVLSLRPELVAWYERRGYEKTGERTPFPYGDDKWGLPKRADLEFYVLRKSLTSITSPGAGGGGSTPPC